MRLTGFDIAIILGYLIIILLVGLVLRKRAQKSTNSYLLGGNSLPWYMLGLSNASGMFDISGTMWLVTILFVYGLKSIWIPWLWPVFNQIFLMMFLSMWLRRSNVTTGAEWIQTRFGRGRDSKMSHTIIVIFALVMGLGYLAYGFIGIGKFVEIFVPWSVVAPYMPFDIAPEYVAHFYGIVFTCFAIFYSLLGGMMSIVWADVFQYILMAVSGIVIGVIAMHAVVNVDGGFASIVPDGWLNPFFGKSHGLDWSGIISQVNDKIQTDGYGLFSIFFTMLLFKGVLVSLAGPAPTYDMQKILSSKSPREAALMSGSVSVVLMPVRYFMIAGFAILGLIFFKQLGLEGADGTIDFEKVLPAAINQFVPVGLLGLLLAGLIAAFMSTFAGTLNATQAYIVNDIYLKYINPKASNKKVTSINITSGLIMVVISIFFGFFAQNVNAILNIIVSGLYGSYVAANILKWYWWRFNGKGFFWGMVCGLVPVALIFLIPGISELYIVFPLMLLLSTIGCIVGTYSAPPVDEESLKSFYKNVRPWGFWGPIKQKVMAEDPSFEPNKDFKRDMMNVAIGIVWQTALVVFPIFMVLCEAVPTIISLAVVAICSIILKKTWYDKLPQDKPAAKPEPVADEENSKTLTNA